MSDSLENLPVQDTGVDAARIAANLDAVRARIADACTRAGRAPDSVTLVAVSKTHPLEAIQAAAAHGQTDFGENRLEELWEKARAGHAAGITGLRWHMIGTIQSRKTDLAIGPFHLIHAIDRVRIAQRINREALTAACVVSVLLEVNVSGEESKHGFTPDELRAAMPDLLGMRGLSIEGLMTMAPLVEDPETVRPVFQALRALRDELAAAHRIPLPHLSMGMSNDFEIAIEEGATLVRVGTSIFGKRHVEPPIEPFETAESDPYGETDLDPEPKNAYDARIQGPPGRTFPE
jgi:pyridoxal phosphate enzyme (YggS family)